MKIVKQCSINQGILTWAGYTTSLRPFTAPRQVFVCHKKGDTSSSGGGYAVKVVDLRRLHLQPNAEREEKKLSREVRRMDGAVVMMVNSG